MSSIPFRRLSTSRALSLALLASGFSLSVSAQNIDLAQLGTTHPGFVISGFGAECLAGFSVSGAGDVNGDGLADLIFGAKYANRDENEKAGQSFVIFGKKNNRAIDISDIFFLEGDGFRIAGLDALDISGASVSGAGDVNGDGLADLIVGALYADPNNNSNAGESYVIFGKSDNSVVDLGDLGNGGFRIDGGNAFGYSGKVSGAGDVNGDGLADLIVGADRVSGVGASYVVFGKQGVETLNLGNLGAGGFRISGINVGDLSGKSVSGAGDFNGDGLADLIVGAPSADPNGRLGAGESYVIFGKADSAQIDLSNLGVGGFRFAGIGFGDRLGNSVSGAGDVNGDGLADLIIGAYLADPNGEFNAGESYVVFGKKEITPINISDLGTGGFRIQGFDLSGSGWSGTSVSGAGDLNGDGMADLVIGAPRLGPNGNPQAGKSYVVYGKADGSTVSLWNLGLGGFSIDGVDVNDKSGYSVSGAGDLNGDGLADLIIGAPYATYNEFTNAGESYVIFSPLTPPAAATYRATALGGNAPRIAIGISGDGSNDSTPDSRVWIDFADGDDVSLQTVTLTRNNSSILNLPNTANVMWEVSSDRTGWTSAEVTFKYTDAELAPIEESGIVLYTSPSASGPWQRVPEQRYERSKNQVSANVSTLGFFALSIPPTVVIDLAQIGTTYPGFLINGIDERDFSGRSVSGAGDVNGDGLADLIIGAMFGDQIGKIDAGESYVVFGKTDDTVIDLSNLGSGGFRINGLNESDASGFSVSGAGDVNGDNLADLIIGAFNADPHDSRLAGESYVVFGKDDGDTIDLSNLGVGGFRLTGIDDYDFSGRSVSGAGDVNGDGLTDLIVGAYGAHAYEDFDAGESYVVFGKADNRAIDFSNLGVDGFQINGIDSGDNSGTSVSGAGDVNGDGLADLLVGADGADPNGYAFAGESYVVFGKISNAPVDLENLGAGGFRIDGIDASDSSGRKVCGAGDVNGDGLADIIIGARLADPNGESRAGECYVVFGKVGSDTIDLGQLGESGFRIEGSDADDFLGVSVNGAGDVNGDGFADLIVGANGGDPKGQSNAGESYVVYGKSNNATVYLGRLEDQGFRINGIDVDDSSGDSASGAGDVNADGLADLIVGAYLADPDGISKAGESYVIFSPSTPPAAATYRATALGGNAPRIAIGISGDGSNDSTPDSRAWIDFADGDNVSLQTVTLTRNNSSILNLPNTANVMWEVSSDRTGWTSAEVTFKYTEAELVDDEELAYQLYTAPTAEGPWLEVGLQNVKPERNQISGTVSELGFFALAIDQTPANQLWMLN